MPLKVGVMGGAGADVPREFLERAFQLGSALATAGCITITGACPGLPLAAARGAKHRGGLVVGISPGLSLDEHAFKYESPTVGHDILIFTGSGLMGREVVNIRSSDMITIVGGSSGTLGELAIAYDEGKLIGVLLGTGGISDMVEEILKTCNKDTGAKVIYEQEPQRLVERMLETYHREHFRKPSCFCHACEVFAAEEPSAGSQRDVICGMWIKPETAVAKRTYGAERYVFCSLRCAEQFDIDPDKYRSRSTT